MADNANESVKIYVDLSKVNEAVVNVSEGIPVLKEALNKIKSEITNGVAAIKEPLGNIDTGIGALCQSVVSALDKIITEVERSAVEETAEIGSNITSIVTNVTELASKGKNILSGKGNGNQPREKQKENTVMPTSAQTRAQTNSKGQLLLPAAGESSYGKTSGDDRSSLGLVSGGLMDLGSSFPSAESLAEVATGIGAVAIKLKESAVAWGQELAAKVASRAEDLKIIAVNTVEHVKAFGIMIGQLAASAAAWVAETAAKVANTAAQWAQIAATTAWQAICVAATAVTTAFGAAVNFLTSPIGLVVVAITALIAIIVLLVQNWDTVKAAALSVWESIQSAFSTVAEWFNINVIQPVVGFFTSAMDWISTKLQEGKEFMQTIFNGISEFLKGAFAKDWTEQFGAFGNVLNAFFTNVQNIWNAVKQIFNGIVDFVKNVFAGNWSAAWSSITDAFKGMWDYLVSLVKVPINGIIGLINGLMSGVVSGINMVIKALNQLHFDFPDWVPGLGGKSFGFNLKTITAPQIPYLAKGAVLPANKPFLAVVGDQKHGTNVEAPLATIQEAVALVMDDHISAMMAGFEALLQEQRAIRQTVEGIEIGDSVIGRAAQRYNRKMAMVKGGY